jgi:uncharacterized protein YqgC (DUF456 family)
MLAIGLGGGSGSISMSDVLELARLIGWVGIAGLLYCWSGLILWMSIPSVHKQSVVLIGCALVSLLAHCIQFVAILNGRFGPGGRQRQSGDPYDEEVVMFVFVPMAAILLVTVQFEYLRRKSKRLS